MEKIENIVAERHMIFRKDTGETISCKMTIGIPYEKTGMGFACAILISGFEDSYVREVYGFDSFQALKTAYEILNVFFCIYQRDGKFCLDETDFTKDENILPLNLYSDEYNLPI